MTIFVSQKPSSRPQAMMKLLLDFFSKKSWESRGQSPLVPTAKVRNESHRQKRSSCKERKGNALALRADEGRDKLR